MLVHRTAAAIALVLVLAMVASAGAVASSSRTAGVLTLDAWVRMKYQFGDQYCPAEAPKFSRCVRFTGVAPVPGLGATTVTYTKFLPADGPADCPVTQNDTVGLVVAGKGRLDLARPGPNCGPTAPATTVSTFDVVAATGVYAGASGQLRVRSVVAMIDFGCNCGKAQDTWSGTVTVPGADFDVTPPTLTGAASKTVRASGQATRVRARYAVTARDAVDGAVAVTCVPPSGTWFRVGQNTVTCSASDSSGNTRHASFKVIVKRG